MDMSGHQVGPPSQQQLTNHCLRYVGLDPLPRYLTAIMFLVLKIIDEIIRSDNCNSD